MPAGTYRMSNEARPGPASGQEEIVTVDVGVTFASSAAASWS